MITVGLLAAATISFGLARSDFALEDGANVLQAFRYEGCAGDWDEEVSAPSVWKQVNADSVVMLTKHAETCGYDSAGLPVARLVGDSLVLDYSLDTSSGMLAACICQYWARFELESSAAGASQVKVHDQVATQHKGWPRER